jgi:hypothetical protein
VATLANSGAQFGNILTPSAALLALPNGAGTMAALTRQPSVISQADVFGLVVGSGTPTDWLHAMQSIGSGGNSHRQSDDDGLVGPAESATYAYTAGQWLLLVCSWPGSGAALERFDCKNITAGSAWVHNNSSGNNGGLRAGSGTRFLRVGFFADNGGSNEIGLVGVWAGTQLTSLQSEELAANLRTSDWWNCSGGQPTALVELNTTTPTDIGASASAFNSIGTLTLTGGDPTGWTFDGRGAVAEKQTSYFSRSRIAGRR